MADDRRQIPERREAQLFIGDVQASLSLIVNANVTDVTERAARAAVDVAVATHVTPKQVVMRYAVGGTVILAVAVFVVLWMTHAWALPWQVALGAVGVIGVPFGVVAGKVLPKLLEHTAAGSVG
jgi:uncharacterized membrane protein YcjF (UPF0283 family)